MCGVYRRLCRLPENELIWKNKNKTGVEGFKTHGKGKIQVNNQ